MLRNVFLKSLRDQRRALLYWGFGFSALTLLTVAFYPTISEMPEFSELFENSEVLVNLFGGGFTDLTSPEGYLNSQLYSLMIPLLFLIFAITHGSGAIAAEEDRGTLDTLLSTPTTRVQVFAQKFAAMIAAILVLAVVLWLSVILGAIAVGMEIGLFKVAAATFSGTLLGVTFGTLAFALGAATGRRGRSVTVTATIAIVSYFMHSLAPVVEVIEPTRYLSPYYYYIGADPLANGLSLAHVAVLVGLTIAAAAGSVYVFERRDLAV